MTLDPFTLILKTRLSSVLLQIRQTLFVLDSFPDDRFRNFCGFPDFGNIQSFGDDVQKTFGHDCLVFELASVFVAIQNQDLFRCQSAGQFIFQQGFFFFVQGLRIFQIERQHHFRGNFVHVLATGSTAADGFIL